MVGNHPRKKRSQQPSILIRCEGSQTEPNYLGALLRSLNLTAVKIPRDHNTAPISLVEGCIAELKRDKNLLRAYVIFDQDAHPSFTAAVNLATQSPMFPDRLRIIRSYPCFETWLLYHFTPCRSPMNAAQAFEKLKIEFPRYEKGDIRCMDECVDRLDAAIANAEVALKDAEATNAPNPSTEMHFLVADLVELSKLQTS